MRISGGPAFTVMAHGVVRSYNSQAMDRSSSSSSPPPLPPSAPGIAEHHIAATRTARYCTLGTPGPAISEIWIALHGYGQLAPAFARHCLPLAAPQRLVVIPEGLSRFYLGAHTRPAGPEGRVGASWMTREDRLTEIADYVNYLDGLHQLVRRDLSPAASVDILGFSQGTATAARWIGHGEVRPRRFVIW